jgi:hypothetical protein
MATKGGKATQKPAVLVRKIVRVLVGHRKDLAASDRGLHVS